MWLVSRGVAGIVAVALMSAVAVSGCAQADGTPVPDRAQVQEIGGPAVTGTLPLRPGDMRTFEEELFRAMPVAAQARSEFRVLQTQDVAGGTYVLYAVPNNDGLAFAGRRADGSITVHHARWPMAVTDPAQDLVVVRAIPPNNEINPGYGVLAGRVYNPFIEHIEVNYRDGRKDRLDVSHNRGFIFVRKAFDPRFVQVRAYGTNGNPYWNIDTR